MHETGLAMHRMCKIAALFAGAQRRQRAPEIRTSRTLSLPWATTPRDDIEPSAGFNSLEEELKYLNSLEYKAQEFGPPYLFEPPFFIAKRGKETNELLNHYKKSTEKLAQTYLEKPFSQFLTEQAARS